jgi:hypothetical protein
MINIKALMTPKIIGSIIFIVQSSPNGLALSRRKRYIALKKYDLEREAVGWSTVLGGCMADVLVRPRICATR